MHRTVFYDYLSSIFVFNFIIGAKKDKIGLTFDNAVAII